MSRDVEAYFLKLLQLKARLELSPDRSAPPTRELVSRLADESADVPRPTLEDYLSCLDRLIAKVAPPTPPTPPTAARSTSATQSPRGQRRESPFSREGLLINEIGRELDRLSPETSDRLDARA
jgi:hypothetical protein